MRRALSLFTGLSASLLWLVACSAPVTTSQKTVTSYGNNLQVVSGTDNNGRFIMVANAQKTWEGVLKGGKEKWIMRRDFLNRFARDEIEKICGSWFVAIRKGPIYNMLDNDETMGGVAPALGVAFSMAAYLAAEAATKDTNVPASAYIEYSCQDDKK